MNLKVKAEIKKVESEKDEKLKGFADLTIGDFVIKNVAIKENKSKEGSFFTFDIPLATKYENSEGMVYVHTVDLTCKDSEKEKDLIKAVRKVITEAMISESQNEFGKFVAEKETSIDYDKDFIMSYVSPIKSEKYPSLRANATVYIAGILKLNQIRLTEYEDIKTGEKINLINFPSRKFEQNGETIYKEQVFPIEKGLREKIRNSVEEEYLKELQKQSQTEEIDEEEDER